MSLSLGTAPFGQHPGGVFNAAVDVSGKMLYFEDSPRRVRGVFAGETVVDSRRVKLLHEFSLLPVWYFPEEDVRMDLLEPTDRSTRCPHKGEASYWSIRVGDRVEEDAAWSYPEPIEGAPPLAGYLAFYWHKIDEWYEEDEKVFVHPRDPYHRVDVLPTSRHVRVSLDGELLAETERAHVLFETALPPRWYMPREDVRSELLEESDSHTQCPYKGTASYWSVRVGDRLEDDLVWYYPDPISQVEPIANLLCFFNERVDLEVDGELQERPETQWSRSARARVPLPAER